MNTFKIEKSKKFSSMPNHYLDNAELSLGAKGLMSIILSLPDDFNCTTKSLTELSTDKFERVCEIIQELENHGYITCKRI